MLTAGDAFFAVYLFMLGWTARKADAEATRRHARIDDDGLALIAVLTASAVALSLGAIFWIVLLSRGQTGIGGLAAATASVPLGWATMHAAVALHYARLYYADAGDGAVRGGLAFPGEDKPDLWDFLYFSFVIGMTAQTSDTAISARAIRRLALAHGVVSFFYNTVIVALTVNVAVQIAS
ncbi:MAG: DUF1345 domain-containing protein [Alphaproteobacteria bacterium]